MHFDIGRRYADCSFRRTVSSLSDTDALEMFTDAANKLQSHYVQHPDWATLVNRGTADLEIALAEQTFQENNSQQINPDRVEFVSCVNFATQQAQHPVHYAERCPHCRLERRANGAIAIAMQPAATMLEFTAAMLGGLDEYSSFLTSGQLNDLYSQIEGNFVGLGVELKAADGALLIVNVIHNSPAERAGIKAGDQIVSVGRPHDHAI